jgi:hypothetical protein
MRKRLTLALASSILAAGLIASPTFAAGTPGGPDGQWCWGVVSSQRASTYHDLGSHVSSQSEPRLGLANVARLFFSLGFIDEPSVYALGSFLASVDELSATGCVSG